MAFRFVLLVLPALALANIDVELNGKFDGDTSDLNINYGGKDSGLITDTERNSFSLNDNGLKNAVRSYFGQRPDDAFLRSPTPWGDLYQTYGWSEVTRTLIPQNGKILEISSQPTIVVQQVFENNSTKTATFNVGISQSVLNTYTSTWWTNSLLSIESAINYKIKIAGNKSGELAYFNYPSVWNQNTRRTQPVTVGSSSAIYITLKPGQAVVAQLQATRGSIKMQVEYAASLAGHTAVNYADSYNGHHFWGLSIADCMTSAGISNQLMSREIVDIGFYSDSMIIVSDRDHGNKLMEVPF